ncbi:hypothetical protein WME95_17980 [Sorangium sp. So ce327]|uniref:hypothetical protein n=1 Tax=Sorangium sp. So ce327 TaxID=3133301 RepID=UPI003F628393
MPDVTAPRDHLVHALHADLVGGSVAQRRNPLRSMTGHCAQGLRFITRRPRVQWAAMVQRMKTLEEERAQVVIEQFGGTRHYRQLVAAHARFGEAYGFTTVVLAKDGGPTDGRPHA